LINIESLQEEYQVPIMSAIVTYLASSHACKQLTPKEQGPFLACFWSLGSPLWMQYLSKKSQIFGEHVV
jgi:hypothetical protein